MSRILNNYVLLVVITISEGVSLCKVSGTPTKDKIDENLSSSQCSIIIGLFTDDTIPLLVRLEVQIGNHAPEGTLEDIDDVVSGTVTISWTASDPDEDSLTFDVILVNPDGSEVTLDSDMDETSYSFDSTDYPDNTGYKIIVEISDGIDTTQLESSFFEIKNDENPPEIGAPGFEFLFSILALSLVLLFFRKKK